MTTEERLEQIKAACDERLGWYFHRSDGMDYTEISHASGTWRLLFIPNENQADGHIGMDAGINFVEAFLSATDPKAAKLIGVKNNGDYGTTVDLPPVPDGYEYVLVRRRKVE